MHANIINLTGNLQRRLPSCDAVRNNYVSVKLSVDLYRATDPVRDKLCDIMDQTTGRISVF